MNYLWASSHLFLFLCPVSPQMVRVDAPTLTPTSPALATQLPYKFDVMQSSLELLKHFKLFCDWATRAFISLRPKVPAVQ